MIPPGYRPQADGTVIGPSGKVRKMRLTQVGRGGGERYYITARVDGKGRNLSVHRLVCEAFHGPAPFPGAQVRHLDGNRLNNQACNLAWGTVAENRADRDAHGTTARGERHGCAKLTERQVRQIRERYAAGGVTQTHLAKEYGVGQPMISDIVTRRRWASLDLEC
jgi:hypothetical protein